MTAIDEHFPQLGERLAHLDRARHERRASPKELSIDDDAHLDADVVIAGGGLWSLLAPILAARGLSVVVVERARTAEAHREWNASASELEALVRVGLVDRTTLAELVVARYDRGTCTFHGGRGPHVVHGVLDCAVDAGRLLAIARALGEARGVRYLDGHTVLAEGSSKVRVAVATDADRLVGRVLVDARGASSPYASADLVCPTVGGVMTGLDHDPKEGEILATIDPIDDRGRQHVWEAFPGRNGELTVYVFFYARREEDVSLAALYERFFRDLPAYKRGDAKMLRPTFGFIPGWSRLSPAPSPPPRSRIALVGDAAARHSPLTYCGFGATLRSLERAADAIARAVDRPGPLPDCIVDDAPVHRLTGALADLLASRRFAGQELNALLDAAFGTLAESEDAYRRLLQDEMTAPEVISFLRHTAKRHPAVWKRVIRGLGPLRASRWAVNVARSLRDVV